MEKAKESKYDVIVIGAGASGLLAAYYAAKSGKAVAVLERNNEAAKKIYATGNGRCNYLNRRAESANLIEKELLKIGIAGTEEEGGRMYPLSREARSVAGALIGAAAGGGAELICDCHVTDVQKTSEGFKCVSKDGRKFLSEKLVIAAGGKAGIQFGCYGEGYRWAQYMGHSLVKPIPALAAMECSEDISGLHGVRVHAAAKLLKNGECIASESGEVQFTRDSISGICVMNLSRSVRLEDGAGYSLRLDLFPGYSKKELSALLLNQRAACGSMLFGLLPEKLRRYLTPLEELGADELAEKLKNLSFDIKGTKGWTDAQVTSGGVPLNELDPETMESKIVPGLYFTGEITDYDGPCGGFNLANAWRTGMLAGQAAGRS